MLFKIIDKYLFNYWFIVLVSVIFKIIKVMVLWFLRLGLVGVKCLMCEYEDLGLFLEFMYKSRCDGMFCNFSI